jgi:hypothetical protein
MSTKKTISRKTRRKKGGSPHKTIEESLLSKKIPQSIIDFEISKFLKPEDNYTLRHTEIIDFKPTIRYEFEYDEDSHYMDGDYNIYNFSGENFKLTNTRFDDNVKKRIDACVIYDAKLYQIEEKGKVTDLKPKIDVTVILSELKVKGQATRPPYENTNIVINTKFGIDKKSKKPDYKVTLLTSVGNKVLHLLTNQTPIFVSTNSYKYSPIQSSNGSASNSISLSLLYSLIIIVMTFSMLLLLSSINLSISSFVNGIKSSSLLPIVKSLTIINLIFVLSIL